MLPIIYYGIIIPFFVYVVPAGIIYLLVYRFYVTRLQAGAYRTFLWSKTGKFCIGLISLILVLLIYVVLALVFKF